MGPTPDLLNRSLIFNKILRYSYVLCGLGNTDLGLLFFRHISEAMVIELAVIVTGVFQQVTSAHVEPGHGHSRKKNDG